MKQILIATHGKMASGILYTAEMVLGKQENVTAINAYVDPETDVEKEFDAYFQERKGQRIIVMTDLAGGSVNQKLMQYAAKDRNITLITGINFPFLLQILLTDGELSNEEIQSYLEAARQEMKLSGVPEGIEESGKNKAEESEAAAGKVQAAEAAADTETDKFETETNEKNERENQDTGDAYQHSEAEITALRIDDRLIHGQVAMTWTKQLKVQGILVANDVAASDNTQKMALKMAAPAGIKVLVKPLNEAIRVLNYPKASEMRILVLTRTIKDALAIRKCVKSIDFLNLGNTGRFDGIDVSEKIVLTPTIMLTQDELMAAKELAELDERFCMQQVPNDEKRPVKEAVEKL